MAECWFSTLFDPAYAALAGVHRIQRVPLTEKQGRRHSSDVTVVALSGASSVPFHLDRSEVRVDFYRSSGKGGQNRNKVETAVRLVHVPTGTMVTATEQRQKGQNLSVAWERMESALSDQHRSRSHQGVNQSRAEQFGASRSFTWTSWRDEVKSSDGRRVSMKQALRGKLDGLMH